MIIKVKKNIVILTNSITRGENKLLPEAFIQFLFLPINTLYLLQIQIQ